MNLTNTGKKTEGGVALEFSPKYSTAESYTSWKTEATSGLYLLTWNKSKHLNPLNTFPRGLRFVWPGRFSRQRWASGAARCCCWGTSAAPGCLSPRRTPSGPPPCLSPEPARPAGCCPEKLTERESGSRFSFTFVSLLMEPHGWFNVVTCCFL